MVYIQEEFYKRKTVGQQQHILSNFDYQQLEELLEQVKQQQEQQIALHTINTNDIAKEDVPYSSDDNESSSTSSWTYEKKTSQNGH